MRRSVSREGFLHRQVLCEAVAAIDPGAWNGPPTSPAARVTDRVTFRVTGQGTRQEKTPTTLSIVGVTEEREKGFDLSARSPVFSRPYENPENAPEDSTRPADASVHVPTEIIAGDSAGGPAGLPSVTPDLFLAAGAIVAHLVLGSSAPPAVVGGVLRRAVQQAGVLRKSSGPDANPWLAGPFAGTAVYFVQRGLEIGILLAVATSLPRREASRQRRSWR